MPAAQVREATRHPGHERAHHLAVPRQAVDEGGAARRPACRRRPRAAVDSRGRGARVRRAGRLPAHPQAARRRRRPGHDPGRRRRGTRCARCRPSAPRAPRRSPSRSSSRATRASTTPSPSTARSCTTGSRTTTPTCSRRCATAGSRRSSSPPTASTTGNAFYGEVRELGRRVIEALGIGTSATHMEWFYGPKGLRFSEIGCRPPGVGAWDLYSAANEVDVYREWAHVITHGTPEQPHERRVRRRHRRAAPGPRRADPRLLAASTRSRPATASGSSTATSRPRATAPRPSRPATWPTPTCGCATPTTTRCAAMLDDVGRTDPRPRRLTPR